MPDFSFFYHVLKPGRYLGGESGLLRNGKGDDARKVVWYFPGRYEEAMADPGWRRGYFQLAGHDGIQCCRAIEYARDVWERLKQSHLPVFTLDGLDDINQAEIILFWAPDVFSAAHIPSILARLSPSSGQTVGVVTNGSWAPRFLAGHIDWVVPAPHGWLPPSLFAALTGAADIPENACPGHEPEVWDDFWGQKRPSSRLSLCTWTETPRWISTVEIGDDFADVDLVAVGAAGRLCRRSRDAVVADALSALNTTGIDGLRFCDSDVSSSALIAGALSDLGRISNTRRVRACWPAVTAGQFTQHWESFRPHIIKPRLRLLIDVDSDPTELIEIGNRALNAGWQSLAAVAVFDRYENVCDLTALLRKVITGWRRAAESFADKRPIRIEYQPAGIDRWQNPPSEPGEAGVRRLASEFRHFKEDLARVAAVGTFRIEDVMARNWLAAADPGIWHALEELVLADPNDDEAPALDWFNWVRQTLGSQGPPQKGFLRFAGLPAASMEEPSDADTPSHISVVQPGDHLFGRRKRKAGFTRRLAAPSRLRMRTCFAKEDSWRLYSHLDCVRAIERAIRRAKLPITYSEGFHPRMKISFGPPLPFGVLSDCEYFDLVLSEDYEPVFADRLSRTLPEGIILKDARGFAVNTPSLSESINEAAFRTIIPTDFATAQTQISAFLQQPEVSFRRADRPGRKPFDPRRSLREMSVEKTPEGTVWNLRVRLGAPGSIRPADWATLIFAHDASALAGLLIRRTELLIRQGGRIRTPLETP